MIRAAVTSLVLVGAPIMVGVILPRPVRAPAAAVAAVAAAGLMVVGVNVHGYSILALIISAGIALGAFTRMAMSLLPSRSMPVLVAAGTAAAFAFQWLMTIPVDAEADEFRKVQVASFYGLAISVAIALSAIAIWIQARKRRGMPNHG